MDRSFVDKPVFVHKLQQDNARLTAGLLADADITNKPDPAMVRALLD